ncbi:hypothetical protein [Methanocaldococcus fervens]|uniref:GINS subunit domain-containing protein n=1 Tax=Methanocaldococcus fervens (strain DSM 4213 / JCM 15782 / AG86) TaxID=573064 RepID=C7P6T4_METFA|nr:hypothetical protein [Methanocaldococcus fervens]ACV24266.1 hypothetical protein Mefer_0440 [Methanocaldococcus fervens AG86]
MDVYEILYQSCLEYKVLLNGEETPLWKLKKEDLDKVDLDLPWTSIRDLAIYLYELKKKQQNSKELIKCDIVEILVGIALLKPEEGNSYMGLVTEDMCLNYLSELITARINCIAKYYYMMKKPQNTNIFDEIILKFPQKRDIRASNINDFRELVGRIRSYFK